MNTAIDGKIESLACEIKFGNLPESRLQSSELKLLSLIMQVKFKEITSAMTDEKNTLLTVEESPGCGYDGIILSRAYKYAIERYGELDMQTGERIPFFKLFNSYKKFKGVKAEKLQAMEHNKLITARLKELLNKIRNENDLPPADRCDFLNKEKCIEQLKKWNVADRYAPVFEKICGEVYVLSAEALKLGGQETGMVLHDDVNERAADKLTALLDELLNVCKDKKCLELCRVYLYFKFLQSDVTADFNYEQYIDKNFAAFCQGMSEKFVLKHKFELAGRFAGYKPDTVRKKFSFMDKLALEVAGRRIGL